MKKFSTTFILPTAIFLILVSLFQNCGKGDFKTIEQASLSHPALTDDPNNDDLNDQPEPHEPPPQQPPLPPEPPATPQQKKYFLYVAVSGTNVIETYSINSTELKHKNLVFPELLGLLLTE